MNEHKNLHFDNEQEIHMNSKEYVANGCRYNLISH